MSFSECVAMWLMSRYHQFGGKGIVSIRGTVTWECEQQHGELRDGEREERGATPCPGVGAGTSGEQHTWPLPGPTIVVCHTFQIKQWERAVKIDVYLKCFNHNIILEV